QPLVRHHVNSPSGRTTAVRRENAVKQDGLASRRIARWWTLDILLQTRFRRGRFTTLTPATAPPACRCHGSKTLINRDFRIITGTGCPTPEPAAPAAPRVGFRPDGPQQPRATPWGSGRT